MIRDEQIKVAVAKRIPNDAFGDFARKMFFELGHFEWEQVYAEMVRLMPEVGIEED